MTQFPHLKLLSQVTGKPRYKKSNGPKKSQKTEYNLANRSIHADFLINKSETQDKFWKEHIEQRKEGELPDLPNSEVIPLLLTVDPSVFDIESLKGFDIEIISEEDGGLIIGATADSFFSLHEKIEKFRLEKPKSGNIAKLWDIEEGIQWKIERILSPYLLEIWDTINDDGYYTVDISISCYRKLPDIPEQREEEIENEYQKRLDNWRSKVEQIKEELDELSWKRQTEFEKFIKTYGGDLLSGFVTFSDSFACRVQISGLGLKDVIFSYQYIFSVTEVEAIEPIEVVTQTGLENYDQVNILAPASNAPRVCIIDSGIQEGHRLLSPAIDTNNSYNFLEKNSINIADKVKGGGHGTKVAGAVLFPVEVPKSGDYILQFFIQNAVILDDSACIPDRQNPAKLLENIVEYYHKLDPPTRIFNLSINSLVPCRKNTYVNMGITD